MVKAAASIIAPATLITALMYYFGLLHVYWFFGGFGVDYTFFELSPEDYVLRSADGLFFPFSIAALGVLLLAWACQLVAPRLAGRSAVRYVRAATPLCSLLGLALMMVAGVAVLRPARFVDYPALGGMALVFGVLLLTAATRALRWLADRRGRSPRRPPTSWAVAEWSATVILVSVGLFWAVADYSARVGSQRAQDVVQALPDWPSLTLYSERSLNLGGTDVIETACSREDAAFAYRYDGLVLITQEGGQLLILPRTWAAMDGTAIVLTRTDALRLDFSPVPMADAPSC